MCVPQALAVGVGPMDSVPAPTVRVPLPLWQLLPLLDALGLPLAVSPEDALPLGVPVGVAEPPAAPPLLPVALPEPAAPLALAQALSRGLPEAVPLRLPMALPVEAPVRLPHWLEEGLVLPLAGADAVWAAVAVPPAPVALGPGEVLGVPLAQGLAEGLAQGLAVAEALQAPLGLAGAVPVALAAPLPLPLRVPCGVAVPLGVPLGHQEVGVGVGVPPPSDRVGRALPVAGEEAEAGQEGLGEAEGHADALSSATVGVAEAGAEGVALEHGLNVRAALALGEELSDAEGVREGEALVLAVGLLPPLAVAAAGEALGAPAVALTRALLGVAKAVAVGSAGEGEAAAVSLDHWVSEAGAEAERLRPEVTEAKEEGEAPRGGDAVLAAVLEGETVTLVVPPPLPLCSALLEIDTEADSVRQKDADAAALAVAFKDTLPHPELL